jgi:murein L,D-transpeptidase YcbB/YkuD
MRKVSIYILSALLILCYSCHSVTAPEQKDIVEKKEFIDEHIENNIPKLIDYAADKKGRINDSITLNFLPVTRNYYSASENKPLWSDDGKWMPYTAEFVRFIKNGLRYGLFPSDYHFSPIINIQHRLNTDSAESKNAVSWGTADILLTDAFFTICHDLRVGRLPKDSLSVNKDSLLTDTFYGDFLNQFVRTGQMQNIAELLEPVYPGYQALKTGLGHFLDSVEFTPFTYINYPTNDSIKLYQQLQRRFVELNLIGSESLLVDTTMWKQYLREYQAANKMKVTGKLNDIIVNRLNATPWERLKQIAITLDKYKQLPDSMPLAYVMVNIPTFRLKVIDSDSIAFESRVVVGAPATRTPELSSEVSNFITYPQWTVPFSIVFNEMLPKIQKDVAYLDQQNLMVVDRFDSIIDPTTVDWLKLNKTNFPYTLKQRQGDDNSLGVIKFNFRNKYSVYLHDTNARYMFQRSARALSHGCVRVQQWQKFADYLIRNDTLKFTRDSLISWIDRKEKKLVQGFQRIPIFIRYYTCEGANDRVVFHDDVYGTDKYLREKYFSDKSIINIP